MTNAEYMKSCSDYGLAKEVLEIARNMCKGCRSGCCEGVEECVFFSERYGAPSLAEWLKEERKC